MRRLATSQFRIRFAVVAVTALVAGAASTVLPASAFAQDPAALPSGCIQVASTVTCSYGPTGAEQQFAVPAGVVSLHVSAVGAAGGDSTNLGNLISGGLGALANATLPVTPGADLYVEVGGASSGVVGGFNGGANGSINGAGGGGASDVRGCSRTVDQCAGGDTLDSRLLVAAGGGGAGGAGDAPSGAGGSAGVSPQAGAPGADSLTTSGGGGGAGATVSAGGSGGTGGPDKLGTGAAGFSGANGARGMGGAGAADLQGAVGQQYATGGGGGGGGWFGGGGAGSASDHYIFAPAGFRVVPGAGGGGGAGSSYLDPAAVNGSINSASAGQVPAVTITYSVPATAPAAPTIGSVTATDGSATVAFSAGSDGGSPITGYTVTASPGGRPASGNGSPITVTGLTNGTSYTFTVTATNGIGTGLPSAASDPVTPVGLLAITTSGLPAATVGIPYAASLTAVGGISPYSWSLASGDALAAGLTLHSDGTITGTPTPGYLSLRFTVQVTDTATPAQSASTGLTLAINPAPSTVAGPPTIGTAIPGNASASVAFTAPATDGGKPITGYTVTASPGGRTATGNGSPITVTGLTNGTSYTFTVTAANSVGTGPASAASNPVTPVAPIAPIAIATIGPLPAGTVGSAYTATLAATGGTAPYSWSLATGSKLPAGLTLNQGGTITGTPSASGSASVIAQVRDVRGQSASVHLSITINAAVKKADLAVSITHTGRFLRRFLGVYQVKVTNTGSAATTTATTISSTLPRGLTPLWVSASGWACSDHGQTASCTHTGSLAAHASSTIVVLMWITAPAGTHLNTTVTAGPSDATPADNTSTDRANVQRW